MGTGERENKLMKIKELIKALKMGDPEKEVYIPNEGKNGYEATTKVGYSYDDVGDIELYKVA